MKAHKKMPGVPEASQSKEKARAFFEAVLWPNGPTCPRCKGQDVYKMTAKAGSIKPGRPGLYRCRPCKRQFTVTVGTIFEGSHVPLHKWLMAVQLMMASKKGMSAHQIHRMVGVTYKAAWFMCHRLRFAMGHISTQAKLRGTVEVDETYVGGKQENRSNDMRRRGEMPRKTPVVALVKRNGDVRTFPVKSATAGTLKNAIMANVDRRSKIMTDRAPVYDGVGKQFHGGHHTVNHTTHQYVRPGNIHTNTVESYFSLLKRGIMGTFHHISREHLAQYCNEFAFRWNHKSSTDAERMGAALKTTVGKRLAYGTLNTQGAF